MVLYLKTRKSCRIVGELHEGVNLIRSREPRLPGGLLPYYPAAYFVPLAAQGGSLGLRAAHTSSASIEDVRIDHGDAYVPMP